MDKYSHCSINKVPNGWEVSTWLVRPDRTVYCQSVHTVDTRKESREFQHAQLLKFAPPEFYQGEGI